MKLHLKILSIIALLLTISCSAIDIKYDREKIEKKYLEKYEIMIDSKKYDFKNVYLDKENIKSIQVNKRKRIVNIYQTEKRDLIKLKDLKVDSLKSDLKTISKDGLVIFNGVPFDLEEECNIIIDPYAISNLTVLDRKQLDTLSTWYDRRGNLILITIK